MYDSIRTAPNGDTQPLFFLAGDSSLDNKYWIRERAAPVGGYNDVLDPPVCFQDVAYHLQSMAHHRENRPATFPTAAINCAVGELCPRIFFNIDEPFLIDRNLR